MPRKLSSRQQTLVLQVKMPSGLKHLTARMAKLIARGNMSRLVCDLLESKAAALQKAGRL